MRRVLVVAPHADDESLGCGGTILRHIELGDEVHWLLVTGMTVEAGFSQEEISQRESEISKVEKQYGFSEVHQLMFPPAALDVVPLGDIISAISSIVRESRPDVVYTAYRNDAHSDHEVVYDAVMSSTKSFRYPFVSRVLAYETLSETDYGLKPEDRGFRPNVYVNIDKYLTKKLDILEIFSSEMGDYPFPRSKKALNALAAIRGVQCNCDAAEAFMLIKEVKR